MNLELEESLQGQDSCFPETGEVVMGTSCNGVTCPEIRKVAWLAVVAFAKRTSILSWTVRASPTEDPAAGTLHAAALAAGGNMAKGQGPSPSCSLVGFLPPCMKRAHFQPAGVVEMAPAEFSSNIRTQWVRSWQTVTGTPSLLPVKLLAALCALISTEPSLILVDGCVLCPSARLCFHFSVLLCKECVS